MKRLIAILVVTGAACSDPGPKSFAGSYGLATVFEPRQQLPVTMYVGGTRTTITQRVETLADTLELRGDGTYIERTVSRGTQNETTNPVVSIGTSTGFGTFTVDDAGSLTFLANTEPANCTLLCGLQLKTAITVLVQGDTLAFQNAVWSGLDWRLRFVRRP